MIRGIQYILINCISKAVLILSGALSICLSLQHFPKLKAIFSSVSWKLGINLNFMLQRNFSIPYPFRFVSAAFHSFPYFCLWLIWIHFLSFFSFLMSTNNMCHVGECRATRESTQVQTDTQTNRRCSCLYIQIKVHKPSGFQGKVLRLNGLESDLENSINNLATEKEADTVCPDRVMEQASRFLEMNNHWHLLVLIMSHQWFTIRMEYSWDWGDALRQ